jgi:hypothetical protein
MNELSLKFEVKLREVEWGKTKMYVHFLPLLPRSAVPDVG